MKTPTTLPAVVCCAMAMALTTLPAMAQETGTPGADPQVQVQSKATKPGHDALIAVLERARATDLNGKVEIKEEKAESPMGGMAVMVGRGGPRARPMLLGEFEVFVSGEVITAVSKSKLPLAKIYNRGSKRLFNVVYSGSPQDSAKTADALVHALDLKSLINEVQSAKRVRVKETEAGTQYRLTIRADYFEADHEGDNVMGMKVGTMFSEAVLDSVLVVQANQDGALGSLSLEVQYNDPMGAVLERAMKGGGNVRIGPGDDLEKSDKVGRKVVVKLLTSETKSARAQAFAEEAAKLLQ